MKLKYNDLETIEIDGEFISIATRIESCEVISYSLSQNEVELEFRNWINNTSTTISFTKDEYCKVRSRFSKLSNSILEKVDSILATGYNNKGLANHRSRGLL